MYNLTIKKGSTKGEKTMTSKTTISEMLKFYGYETIEEFGREYGLRNRIDAERCLADIYEEDNAPIYG